MRAIAVVGFDSERSLVDASSTQLTVEYSRRPIM
jgi:hypothetical protein